MTTHEVSIKGKSALASTTEPELAGTLVLPGNKGPFPAILFVPGSRSTSPINVLRTCLL
jgi:hypothetical protein